MLADERRDSLRKASGRWQIIFDPGMSEWGNLCMRSMHVYIQRCILEREPREVKHLSNVRKINQERKLRDSQSSGERNGKNKEFI